MPDTCPTCREPLRGVAAGKNLRCPACGTAFPTGPARAVPVARAEYGYDDDGPPVGGEPTTEAPYFTVVEARTWTPNRVYRVYSDRRRLIGLYVGRSADAVMLGAQFGLVGAVVAALAANKKPADDGGEKSLDDLVAAHRYNFVLDATELATVALAEPSLWFRLNHATVPQLALLHLRTDDGTTRRLALNAERDVRVALRMLAELAGERFDDGGLGRQYRRR